MAVATTDTIAIAIAIAIDATTKITTAATIAEMTTTVEAVTGVGTRQDNRCRLDAQELQRPKAPKFCSVLVQRPTRALIPGTTLNRCRRIETRCTNSS